MLCEHLGQVVDQDPKIIAFENSVVKALRLRGPLRQRDLWFRSAAQRVGREVFESTLDSLVERGIIVRESTNRVNTFLYRMAPDRRRRERAIEREQAALAQKGTSVTAELITELEV